MYSIRRKSNNKSINASFMEYKEARVSSNDDQKTMSSVESSNPRIAIFNTTRKWAEAKLAKFEELWPGEYKIVEFNDFSY